MEHKNIGATETGYQQIPIDIQLEAACLLDLRKMSELLEPLGFRWDSQSSSLHLSDYKHLFSFSADDLVEYLRQHPETCRRLLAQSYDKRYSPSTFLEEWGGGYRVGWFDGTRGQVRVFDRFEEAAADYVLFSFGWERLPPDEAGP